MNCKKLLLIILLLTLMVSNQVNGEEIKNTANPVSPAIFNSNEIPWEDLGNGMKRKVLFNNNLTFVLLEINRPVNLNEEIIPHSHPQEQITYLQEGKLLVKLGDIEKIMESGGIDVIPPNIPHGVRVLSDKIILIDVFTPTREDFRPKK